MRNMNGVGLIVLIALLAVIEYYFFSAIKFSIKNVKPSTKSIVYTLYILITLAWLVTIFLFPAMRAGDFNKVLKNFLIAFGMGFLITKVLIASFLLIDDLRRSLYYIIGLFFSKEQMPEVVKSGISRSEFMTKFALLFGGTIFGTMIYGMGNRYNYRIRKQALNFAHLPSAFKGLKIIQISDIHSGSLSNPESVLKGVEKILAQAPDIIFFTGDLVNNKSDEMDDYIDIFSKLKAPLGVYSILGNHDYGDYVEWDSYEAKEENLNMLKAIHAKMGWKLLLNEHIEIKKGDDKIAVLGVENISKSHRFHSYGDLTKAYMGIDNSLFKILLSHDPSHWDGETNLKFKDIDLTLAGHTHGMQFGVEIPWLKWSPVQYLYKQWAGLYQKDNQYLYVNRGFGFLGYPGRIGIMPEITLLELS